MNQSTEIDLTGSENNLSWIIKQIGLGHYVVIHSNIIINSTSFKSVRCFHKQCPESNTDFAEKTNVIYIDVSKSPSLLYDGEWNWYICNADEKYHECGCNNQKIAANPNRIKHKLMLTI